MSLEIAMPKRLYFDASDFDNDPNLNIDDTGTLVLNIRVVGVSLNDDENGTEERKSYTVEYSIENVGKDKVSLHDAAKRAGDSKDIYVKTQYSPSPS